jgi:hypothetical protein
METHLNGPGATQSDVNPNPFLDFQLQIRFIILTGRACSVLGFLGAGGR